MFFFFSHISSQGKSVGSGRQVHGRSSSSELSAHQMARAGLAAHSEPEEVEPTRSVDEYGRTWLATAGWPRRWWLFGNGITEDLVWDEPR